jgi:hypothetical protein
VAPERTVFDEELIVLGINSERARTSIEANTSYEIRPPSGRNLERRLFKESGSLFL